MTLAELLITGELKFSDFIELKNGKYNGRVDIIDIFINLHRKVEVKRVYCKLTKKHNHNFYFKKRNSNR